MIMRNEKSENNDPKRIFTRILEALKPYLNIIACDYENHTARVIIKTHYAGYMAVLAYEPFKKTFMIVIRFHTDNNWTLPRLMILLRLQNHTAISSSSINLDTESSILRVESYAPLPAPNTVQAVATATLRDTIHVLEDDDFRIFIN